jgi:hypothetical protein
MPPHRGFVITRLRRRVVAAIAVTAALMAPAGLPVVAADAAPSGTTAAFGPVTVTVVHGICAGGGNMTVRVTRDDADTYTVKATTHGLANRTHWRGGFIEDSNATSTPQGSPLHAVARHGGWTVTATLPAVKSPYFDVVAFGPGRPLTGPFCSLLAQPAHPFVGVTTCRSFFALVITAVYRPGVGVVVRWALEPPHPGTTWRVRLVAVSSDRTSRITVERTAPRRGLITDREVLENDTNPRLQLVAVSSRGQRCHLGMHRVVPGLGSKGSVAESADGLSPSAMLTELGSALTAQRRALGRVAAAPRG